MTHKHTSSFHNNRSSQRSHQPHETRATCPCFNGLRLKHHPNDKSEASDLPADPKEMQARWHKIKNEILKIVREKGIPRELAPQEGYIFHTVNRFTNKIDVLDIPFLHLQTDSQQDLFIPTLRKCDHGDMHTFLMTTRPECERLLESYRLYLLNYAAIVRTIYMCILHERFVLKVSVTQSELEKVMSEVRERLWIKFLKISPDRIDNVEWLKLW